MNEVEALQAALAAEHAIVYGYGVIGAHLSGSEEKYASARLIAHQVLRDRIGGLITDQGATPAAATPAYRLPFPVTDTASAKQLAARLEEGASGAAWDLVAASPAGSAGRSLAVDWLTDATVAAAHWGAEAVALPGRPV